MFPSTHQERGGEKKFQLLHHLEQPCADEETLVEAALAARPRKVVIKRPVKGPLLAGVKPSYQLEQGRSLRCVGAAAPRLACDGWRSVNAVPCGAYFQGCDVKCQPPQYSHL